MFSAVVLDNSTEAKFTLDSRSHESSDNLGYLPIFTNITLCERGGDVDGY